MKHPIALVLGWKWDHEPGIRTVEGELVSVPRGRTMPTPEELEQWDAEYDAFLAQRRPDLTVEAVVDAIVEKGVVTRQEIEAKLSAQRSGR